MIVDNKKPRGNTNLTLNLKIAKKIASYFNEHRQDLKKKDSEWKHAERDRHIFGGGEVECGVRQQHILNIVIS